NSYSVVVTVSDGSQTDTISITINVTDVNEAPVFASNSATRSIDENTAADTNIGDAITAMDDDGDTLTYTLGGTDAASFGIDSTSGQLSTKSALDYEVKRSYSVTITVTDPDNETGSIAVTINVNDVSDVNPPIFNVAGNITLSVAENTAADTNIGDPVTAKRLSPITYSLTGTNANKFSINSRTGQIRTKAALDYETKKSYTVSVVATNSDGSATKDVTINVTDVLESTPLNQRTRQVRVAIIAAIDGVSSAADVTDVHLSSIKTLDLSNKSILSLTTNDFEGLSSLEELDLSSNPILNLHEDVFDDLSSLKTLRISATAITSLPSDVFDGLSSLQELNLNYNSISSLPGDIFDDLTSLKKLYMQNNQISSLVSTLFQKLSSLTHLDIQNNKLSNLPDNIFKGLSSINAIKASGNTDATLEMELTLNIDSSNKITAKVLTGAPFDMVVPVTINNGRIEHTIDLSISKGSIESTGSFEIQVVQGFQRSHSVNINSFPSIPTRHTGLTFVKSSDLPLNFTPTPIVLGAPNSGEEIPLETVLLSNFPNPFNPETWIPYQLSEASDVTITIYNIRGIVVRNLALGHQKAGFYRDRNRAAHWDGRNALGERVATGVYFVTFKAGEFTATRRMLILK
ncbi:cadherin domain-containing protein, partial [Candidatus Poribacteria bacterium]|nr:cadherin domain-containing protein [Candidatus Poribacteria bacterium]